MKNEYIFGGIGATLGVVGTATQVNELLQTISLIITILGAVVSFIVVPLLTWYKNAKKDGKISSDELNDALGRIADGLDKTKQSIKGSQTTDEDKREEIKKKGGDNNG